MDFENIKISVNKDLQRPLDIELLDDWVHAHYRPTDKMAFMDSWRTNGERHRLFKSGWSIKDVVTRDQDLDGSQKKPQAKKNAVDVELMMAVVEYILEADVWTVVIMSGDGDYLPLIKLLKKRGIEVHVLAVNTSLARKLEAFADKLYTYEDLLQAHKLEKVEKVAEDFSHHEVSGDLTNIENPAQTPVVQEEVKK